MFGSHLSIAGSMSNALREAEGLGLDCVQVFTKNQQQWKAPALKREAIDEWSAELARLKWNTGPARITSHASYLINMASHDPALRGKSIELMRDEIERCETLGIPLLVFHPGAFTTSTLEEGMARIIDACSGLIRQTSGFRTTLCLENVAGAGSTIGRRFEELAAMRSGIADGSGSPDRIGFCIDTCHAHAAGYDLSTLAGAEAALDELDQVCGLANVRALHLNDSKGKAGSRLDRHEHIGQGTIGIPGFQAVVNRPEFAAIPKIMETPKGEDAKGVAHDRLNVARLRALLNNAEKPTGKAPGKRGSAKGIRAKKAPKRPRTERKGTGRRR